MGDWKAWLIIVGMIRLGGFDYFGGLVICGGVCTCVCVRLRWFGRMLFAPTVGMDWYRIGSWDRTVVCRSGCSVLPNLRGIH